VGAALRILTGTPVPADCDAVVMQEHVIRRGDAILLNRRPKPGVNVRRRGEDLAQGAEILGSGRVVAAREAAALAAVGAAAVSVRRRVRVAFFCSGDELVAPGLPLAPGQIYNSNRYALLAALAQPWVEARDLGAVRDDPAALSEALRAAAAWADLVITTGGVSVGEEDHLPRVVTEAGGQLAVVRVAIKPGKPLTLGGIGDAIYLGLSGNPVAVHVGWSLIGARIVERLAGLVRPEAAETQVVAGFELRRRPGRAELRPARVKGRDAAGRSIVTILPGSFSARIAELAAADGLVVISAESADIRPGAVLRFFTF
jgi:molybdopterin molybdotransferase